MARLIDADKWLRETHFQKGIFPHKRLKKEIEAQPTVEAVSKGCHDQVRWERDVAIKQLEEHGIPFGGIAPDIVKVVRCEDCIHRKYVDMGDDIGAIGGCGLFCTPMMTCNDFCSYGERKDNDST